MQIQNTTPTLRLDFSTDSQRQALFGRLSEGQTVEARVVDQVAEGKWAVRLMGQTLVAESRLALAPGQNVAARVESMGPPLVLSLTGHARAEETAMNRAFQSLNLADDAVNRAIVRGLIAKGVPIDRNQVQALRQLLTGLQGALDLDNTEVLETVVSRTLFLQQQGMPVTPDALATYLSQLPPGVLGGLFGDLTGLLRGLRLRQNTELNLASLADQLADALPEGGQLTAEALRKLVGDLGVDLEGRLAQWLLQGQDGLPEDVKDSLRGSLLRLLAQLEGLDGENGQVQMLLGRVRDTLQTLDTMQAVNVPTENRDALVLQLPFMMDGQPTTADLQLYYQKRGDGQIDPNNLRFTLALDLSGLGPVRFELTAVNKRASLRIYAADETRAKFLEGELGDLQAGLENCGYAIADIACRVADARDDLPLDRPPTVGVDFRV
ncbi:MAG: hypothetical protein ACI8V2_001624 [Candidatus Latescibacterota bacterium]|jgi:hypothetical protein